MSYYNTEFSSYFGLTTFLYRYWFAKRLHRAIFTVNFKRISCFVMDKITTRESAHRWSRTEQETVTAPQTQPNLIHSRHGLLSRISMMTSPNGHIFRVTGHLWGNLPVTGGFPSQRPVTRSFDVFMCAWTNSWANSRDDTMALILTSLCCSVTIRMVMVPVQYPMPINILKFISVAIHWMFVILWYMVNHTVLYHYLLNRLIRRRSKTISKLCVTDICAGNFPHKWPVTRKMFPFDDVIMITNISW